MFRSRLHSLYRLCPVLLIQFLVVGTLVAQPRASAPKANQYVAGARRAALCESGLQTIENEQIRVGINTCYGGALTYLAFVNDQNGGVRTENMVNNADLGRQVQLALYSGPADYSRNGAPAWVGLGWNPIQAGDVYGNPSQVVTVEKLPNQLYVKTIPKQFAINNETGEATIEHWIRLEGNVVKVHAKAVMFRSDKTQYEARQQEMPCAYLNGDYHNIYYYKGGNPFTNDGLERVRPPTSFGDVFPTEPWIASVNNSGYGVGMYIRNHYDWKKGYFGSDLAGDEFSGEASYIAATDYVVLDHNITHEWDYELVVGHLTDIRSYIYAQPRPSTGPNYRFDTSRKGWYYTRAQDTGWPINGKLHAILTDAKNAQIKSPLAFWRGRANPKVYVRAAFRTQNDKFSFNWRRAEDQTAYYTPDRYVTFPIVNDGAFRTYEVDLSQNPDWLNQNISQIILRPLPDGPPINGWAEIEWISTNSTGPDGNPVSPPPACALSVQSSVPAITSGQSATLTASGCSGGNVTWNNGQNGTSIIINPAQTTSYTAACSIPNASGQPVSCSAQTTLTVSAQPDCDLTVQVGLLTTTVGQSATLTATGCSGGNVVWSDGQLGSTIVVSPGQTTTYTANCTIPNSNGQPQNCSASVKISVETPEVQPPILGIPLAPRAPCEAKCVPITIRRTRSSG